MPRLLVLLIPLSFAYAVVKHRVLDVPVLLKRSARYLLVQRGFTLLLSLVSIGLTLLFAFWLARGTAVEMAQPSGIALGAVFGTVLLWGGSRVHRQVSSRILMSLSRARMEIEYCTQCRWPLRAAWRAQELLTTFERELGAVALAPGSGGAGPCGAGPGSRAHRSLSAYSGWAPRAAACNPST